ncbi:hypothetical protein KAT82_07840 [bacterium]|nr:hypothetical protein [bacterium]
MHFQQGIYEVNRLIEERWAFGERIFSVAFLAMLLGVLIGWRSDRSGAALLVPGYILAAGMPFVSEFSRPMLGSDAQGVALALLPFLVVGLAYAYAQRRWSSLL